MKKIIITAVCLISYFSSRLNITYTADTIAMKYGEFIAMVMLPFIFGGLVGCVGVFLLAKYLKQGIKTYWWVPILSAIIALLPAALCWWIMGMDYGA